MRCLDIKFEDLYENHLRNQKAFNNFFVTMLWQWSWWHLVKTKYLFIYFMTQNIYRLNSWVWINVYHYIECFVSELCQYAQTRRSSHSSFDLHAWAYWRIDNHFDMLFVKFVHVRYTVCSLCHVCTFVIFPVSCPVCHLCSPL